MQLQLCPEWTRKYFTKFHNISSVRTKMMLEILWLCCCGHICKR